MVKNPGIAAGFCISWIAWKIRSSRPRRARGVSARDRAEAEQPTAHGSETGLARECNICKLGAFKRLTHVGGRHAVSLTVGAAKYRDVAEATPGSDGADALVVVCGIGDQLKRARQPTLMDIMADAAHCFERPIEFCARYAKLAAYEIRCQLRIMQVGLDKPPEGKHRCGGFGTGNRVAAVL